MSSGHDLCPLPIPLPTGCWLQTGLVIKLWLDPFIFLCTQYHCAVLLLLTLFPLAFLYLPLLLFRLLVILSSPLSFLSSS